MSIFLFFSMTLFTFGCFGMFLSKRHMMLMLMSLELMLLSANLNFVVFSIFLDDILGQMYAILMLTVAAAETALGLAMLVVYYRLSGGISMDLVNLLKS